jgi:hypothetical protein
VVQRLAGPPHCTPKPRNNRDSTLTGRKNLGRQAIQLLPSGLGNAALASRAAAGMLGRRQTEIRMLGLGQVVEGGAKAQHPS